MALALWRGVTTFCRCLAHTLCVDEISVIVWRCSALGSFDRATCRLGFLARDPSNGISRWDADGFGG